MEHLSNVFIRADGNSQIGLGHLIRCSALAGMLYKLFDITFFCQSIPESLELDFSKSGFKVIRIVDENEFLTYVTPTEIVVLDGYGFDTDFQKEIIKKRARLVCIDDIHDKEYLADLIINHAPGVTCQQYNSKPATQFALGLEYVLLRPPFLDQARKSRKIDKIDTVLICFGGADPQGLTMKAIKVVSQLNKFKKIIVITGTVFKKNFEYDNLLLLDPRIDERHNLNDKQMVDAMLEADLVVVPASGILLEALATGCKVIAGIAAQNQVHMYENFKKTGIIIDAGFFSETELNSALTTGLVIPPDQKSCIDGKTQERIIKLFSQISYENLFYLREATEDDLELTFEWASNSEIRKYSFNQNPISLNEHSTWFYDKISNSSCSYFLAEFNGISVGSIRFDNIGQEAIISYLVDPEYQGRGFGLIILKKGIEKLLTKNFNVIESVQIISGEVMKSNIPSIRSFEHLGFIKNDMGNKYRFEKQL